MDDGTISVTLGGDHNYFIGIYVTAHSICRHASPGTSLKLHIFDAGLDDRRLGAGAGRLCPAGCRQEGQP